MLPWIKTSTDRYLASFRTNNWTPAAPCPEPLAIDEFKSLCVGRQYWEQRFSLKGLGDHWGYGWRHARRLVVEAIDELEEFGYFDEGKGKLKPRDIKELRKLRGTCEKTLERGEGTGKSKSRQGESWGKQECNEFHNLKADLGNDGVDYRAFRTASDTFLRPFLYSPVCNVLINQ